MNSMRAVVMVLAILALCAGGLMAQERVLTDAAGAATGGTVGVAAGTKLGKGISKIFGKVDGGTAKAAAVGAKKTPVILEQPADKAPSEGAPPQVAGHPAPPSRPKAAPRRVVAARPVAQPDYLAPGFRNPPAPRVTKDDLAGIDTGIEREQLVARLGRPSARVLIPEDGYLHEIYLFSGSGMHLGTVELNDGAVTAVNVNAF